MAFTCIYLHLIVITPFKIAFETFSGAVITDFRVFRVTCIAYKESNVVISIQYEKLIA